MTKASDDDYLQGHELYAHLVRGDALIGLIADVSGTIQTMMDALWRAAGAHHPLAYRDLGNCYFATLKTIGAFEGCDLADADTRTWSPASAAVVDDNPAIQAALRCYFQAACLGDRDAIMQFAEMSRHSTDDNQRRAVELLEKIAEPTPAEVYQTGLVYNWQKKLASSAEKHIHAAELGNTDAQFELYVYFAQGLGVEANSVTSAMWLNRAADGNHPRALYNIGASYASGAGGEQDLGKAADYYTRAANLGNGRAAAMLGVMILNDELPGTQANAIEWLNTADEAGYPSWELLDAAGLDDPRDDDDGRGAGDDSGA